jgi:hypothetical protein
MSITNYFGKPKLVFENKYKEYTYNGLSLLQIQRLGVIKKINKDLVVYSDWLSTRRCSNKNQTLYYNNELSNITIIKNGGPNSQIYTHEITCNTTIEEEMKCLIPISEKYYLKDIVISEMNGKINIKSNNPCMNARAPVNSQHLHGIPLFYSEGTDFQIIMNYEFHKRIECLEKQNEQLLENQKLMFCQIQQLQATLKNSKKKAEYDGEPVIAIPVKELIESV